MASFRGHLYAGTAVSAAAALGVDNLRWVQPDQTLALFVLGVAGSLLPDIDADNSTPARVLFTLLGVSAAFLLVFSLQGDFSPAELAMVWTVVFLLVRFGLSEVFVRFTRHRGIWHSWLAAAFWALVTVDLAHHVGGLSDWESWLAGVFLTQGYLTHLCLDEIASVDLRGNRIKRSFGSALKPFSLASPAASSAMLLGAILLADLAPSLDPIISSAQKLPRDGVPSFLLP